MESKGCKYQFFLPNVEAAIKSRIKKWIARGVPLRSDEYEDIYGHCIKYLAKYIRRYDPSKSSLKTWIERITQLALKSYVSKIYEKNEIAARNLNVSMDREETALVNLPAPDKDIRFDALLDTLLSVATPRERRYIECRLAGKTRQEALREINIPGLGGSSTRFVEKIRKKAAEIIKTEKELEQKHI